MDKKIKDEDKQEIIKRLKFIQERLQEVENYCIAIGLNIPEESNFLEDKEKIKFPSGYIRKIDYFKKKYRFVDLFPYNMNLSNNLAYALQCSDVFHYFLSKFNISLSAGKIFIKMGMINVFSIIEGALYGIAIDLHGYCRNKKCEHKERGCYYYAKSEYTFKEILKFLRQKNIFDINEKVEKFILDLKELRDNIHIWEINENEYMADIYNIGNYNRIIILLNAIDRSP